MPRLRLAVCHLCQRRVPLDRAGYSEVTLRWYCLSVTDGFDRCLYVARMRLGMSEWAAYERAVKPQVQPHAAARAITERHEVGAA